MGDSINSKNIEIYFSFLKVEVEDTKEDTYHVSKCQKLLKIFFQQINPRIQLQCCPALKTLLL